MSTVEDLIDEYVGKKAEYETTDGLTVPVTVINVKTHFGRVDLCVTPVHGKGERWVTLGKLVFSEQSQNGSEPPGPPPRAEKNDEIW
tara:strand:+ start:442 stop:702 length:261 start_codon:yes stop_codon:yes gene_type:complete